MLMGTFKIIKPFMVKYKFYLIIYTISILLSYPLEAIIIPKIFSSFFQSIKETGLDLTENNEFYSFSKQIIILMVIINIMQTFISRLEIFLIPEFNEYVSNSFFEKIIKHYENNYTDLELGKILTRINILPTVLREVTTDFFNWILPKLLTIIVINCYFFKNDNILAFISVLFLIIIIYMNMNYFNECINLSHEKYLNYEEKSENLQDKLSNLYSIYSSGNINEEIENFKETSTKFKTIHTKSLNCNHRLKKYNEILITTTFISLSLYIIYIYKIKKIEKEQLITLLMILIFYIPCLNTIISYLPEYANQLGIIQSLHNFIDTVYIKNEIKEDIKITHGKIVFNNLNFGYNQNKQLFNNFNLIINLKEKIGLVGPSGNGKSTLIKLLMGYYPVPNNTIFIDDQDINNYSLNSLRQQITFINQNTKLFNKSIFENIKYGNDISNEQIIQIYNKYNLERIFKNLENKFETIVGVNGDSISGGQKQIILLLRNYFKKNKICILDEPTAALDNETRKIVVDIIKEISSNATLIIITHDLQNLELINRQIKLENGLIILDT